MIASCRHRTVKKAIPWALHMAVVRLQGAEELDYDEAGIRAVTLIEEGSEKFRKAVRVEANRLYKRRFIGELNKARRSWHQKGYIKGFADGKAANQVKAQTTQPNPLGETEDE